MKNYIINTNTYTNRLHKIKSKDLNGDTFKTNCNKEIYFYYDLLDESDIRLELYLKCKNCFKEFD
jgi:hypothetical protein